MENFLNDWAASGHIGMVSDFEDIYITKEEYEAKECPLKNKGRWLDKKESLDKALNSETYKVNILLASYATGDYSGYAFVLFEKDGKLFEVNASHCSCYGLGGQWEPEETTAESLRHRLDRGTLGCDDDHEFDEELRAVLEQVGTK